MEKGRNTFKILTGAPVGKRTLGRPNHRWEDYSRMDPKEIGMNCHEIGSIVKNVISAAEHIINKYKKEKLIQNKKHPEPQMS